MPALQVVEYNTADAITRQEPRNPRGTGPRGPRAADGEWCTELCYLLGLVEDFGSDVTPYALYLAQGSAPQSVSRRMRGSVPTG
jgi:hypothetical protein